MDAQEPAHRKKAADAARDKARRNRRSADLFERAIADDAEYGLPMPDQDAVFIRGYIADLRSAAAELNRTAERLDPQQPQRAPCEFPPSFAPQGENVSASERPRSADCERLEA